MKLAPKFMDILILIQLHPRNFTSNDICSQLNCSIDDLSYLQNNNLVLWWHDDTFTIKPQGDNIISEFEEELVGKYEAKKDAQITRYIAYAGLAISVIAIIAQIVI